jgi:hypothetical protein
MMEFCQKEMKATVSAIKEKIEDHQEKVEAAVRASQEEQRWQ